MVMLRLAVHTVRHRLAGFVASFLALAFAAVIVTVCGGLLETGIRSDVPPQRLLTAPILVTGVQSYRSEPLEERDRVDSGLAGEIATVPGVGRTVGDVSFPVTALRDGRPAGLPALEGHGWSSAQLTPYRLVDGRAPSAPDDVVVDRRLAGRLNLTVGGSLNVLARGTRASLRVAGIAASASSQKPAMFVTDARAQSLLDRAGQVDTVAVYPDSATAASTVAQRLRATLPNGSALVLTGAERGRAEFPDAGGQSTNLIPLAGASGGLMTFVAVFIVASTLALSVELRRRQIALLRAIGATPGQLRRLVLSETFLLALPAVGLALIPTRALGRRLLAAFADHGLVAERLVYHQSFIPTLGGAAIAVVTGLVAALVAARGAIRVRPVEALTSESAPHRWLNWARLLFGVLTLAGAVALALVTIIVFDGPIAASTAEPSAMLWALSVALLAPAAMRPVLWLLGRVASVLAPRTGHLAMLTIQGRGARTAAVVTPVMLAVGLTTALLYLQTSQQTATEQAYARHLRADLVVSSPTGGLPLTDAARMSRMPGVAAASPLVTSTGYFDAAPGTNPDDAEDIPLQGLDGATADRVTNYPVTAGNLSQLTGDTIAISANYRTRTRDVGDDVTLRFGDNATRQLRIVAVFGAQRGYPTLLLPADLLAAHTATGLADQILVATNGHADRSALENSLRDVTPGAQVADRSASLAAFSKQEQTGAWVGYMFIAALIAYTTVSLINTIVAATSQRRPQLRMLRLVGANRGQVAATMTIEAILVAAAGIVLGTFVALATLLPFDSALGAPGLPAGPVWIYLGVTGAATLLTVLVTRLSTRLLHTEPGRA
jgi:putative ABC transport system permease protein